MPEKHATLSASGSHRWLNCPASSILEKGLQGDFNTIFTLEGTLAHAIAELILNGNEKKIDSTVKAFEKMHKTELFYKGMIDEVSIYTDYCKEKLNELKAKDPNAIMYVEEWLNYSKYAPEGFGTGDCILIGNNTLEIVDLKFGKGVPVDPVQNSQLMLYALGAIEAFHFIYNIEKVRMTIAQVRLDGIASYTMRTDDLIKWGETYVKPRAELAFSGKGQAKAGDWCKFCKVKAQCKAKADYELEIVNKYKEAKINELTPADIAEILKRTKEIKSWLTDVDTFALNEALQGTLYPGFKLVEGRSNRKIKDEEGLAEALENMGFKDDEIYKPKEINNITNLEKLVGKKSFVEVSKNYVVKPSGKPTLVPEDDPRKELNNVENEFDFE